MINGIPHLSIPSRGLPDRGLPGALALVSTAEQIGQIPERGVSIGGVPLRSVLAYGSTAIISGAEQIGAIPERGISIGGIILRGIPIYGYILSKDYGGRQFGWIRHQAEIREKALQEERELLELIEIICMSGVLDE